MVAPRRLSWTHALAGAAVATCLFEVLKWGFGLYIAYFPSYEAIYGALATIPILLVWVFLAWAVILFGAEVAAALLTWARGWLAGPDRSSLTSTTGRSRLRPRPSRVGRRIWEGRCLAPWSRRYRG